MAAGYYTNWELECNEYKLLLIIFTLSFNRIKLKIVYFITRTKD